MHIGGPVVYLGGGHELAALGNAGHQHGLEVGARRVHRSGVASGAGAQNQYFGVFGVRHGETFSDKKIARFMEAFRRALEQLYEVFAKTSGAGLR